MIIGYLMWGRDNKYNMFEDVELDECAKYKDIYTLNVIDPRREFKNIKSSLSTTYDNFVIVDGKFKKFCEQEGYPGLQFVELNGSQKYYWFKLENVIAFDPVGRETRFIGYSEKCNGYEEVIGATPAYLRERTLLPDGFFRTDLCFGSYATKGPLYVVGVETKRKIEAAGFKNIDFEKVLDEYP